ncbi:MAG: site-specific DNA-methyltransferase [Mariniphaga sp.]|nr:site-specific DNA-methyltransferase [Mariniphaga sp.]
MAKKITSIKHAEEKRAHIPSQEEAGYEAASTKVKAGKKKLELPKNPVVHRGQDPELFWKNKYGEDDLHDLLNVDIRSLYRHEHMAPEKLIAGLHRIVEEKQDAEQLDMFSANELFGNALEKDELEKVSDYYHHHDGWTNRLIQGDSLLVMTSLLEREGMAGQVQCFYFDPPYGIKYNSNWQMKLNDRNVKDGKDEHVSGEPEMIKAFRDTWELGIHSYLSYLRDRLLVARELLTDSGSCFVQISDENVHLVRCLMDEVFGSENFVAQITVQKTSGKTSKYLDTISDFIIFYCKDQNSLKYRQLLDDKMESDTLKRYNYLDTIEGKTIKLNKEQIEGFEPIPEGRRWGDYALHSQGETTGETSKPFIFNNEIFYPKRGRHWSNPPSKLENAAKKGRIIKLGNDVRYKRYADDYPVKPINNVWTGTAIGKEPLFVVQTAEKIIQRCILMTTDPGDLVLDPTCGSGTTAYVAEQWGRRWITLDTSRIALNIAKTRLTTATFPFYHLYSDVNMKVEAKDGKLKKSITEKPENQKTADIRQGFVYEEVPHITLKSLANDEPPSTETLYDKPLEDKKKLRVTGPFTVETLQNYEPVSPDEITQTAAEAEEMQGFEERVFEHLKSAGVKTGVKGEQAVFVRVERLTSPLLNAQGFYNTTAGEKKAYFHIGPKFGTVSKQAVNEAVKECRQRGDADWLIILGFSFQDDIVTSEQSTDLGIFMVTKARMHDDLMQDGLLKKDRKAGSFITIGEPDIQPVKTADGIVVEVRGLDIYDPIKDEVKARNVSDIAFWMVDDNYDGSNFVVKQVFFCGGDKKEFDKWRKGLENIARQSVKRKAEKTLRVEIDDDAFDRLYGFRSHPIAIKHPNQKIAVRVVSQFGEESTKVVGVKD